MKKQLDTTGIANELKGASVFFAQDPSKRPTRTRPSKPSPAHKPASTTSLSEKEKGAPASNSGKTDGATDKASQRAPIDAGAHSPKQARYQASMIESIRKVVRVVGKEVAFVRLTPPEKHRMGEVVYVYKRQGIKTSENELLRIGLAYLLADYDENGKESMLERVIAALNR